MEKKNHSENSNTANIPAVKNKLFPIVVIGASAGGLEAYSELLRYLPNDTGMSYVIIQHLNPKHKSFLNAIVSRLTKMKVQPVKEGVKPKPNTVYVIQPNTTITFSHGCFCVSPRKKSPKIHMPIDIFMRSLVEDHTHYVVGVLLSGADSDGVIGLEYIKSQGGLTFAQDEKTAKFNDMPHNAIAAGVVDFIFPPRSIARELAKISKNPYLKITNYNSPETLIPDGDEELFKIFSMLQMNNGIDFKNYKPTTVKRRILRRMIMHKIKNVKEYVSFIKKNNHELDALCNDILINVTSFFRDPEMYESLKENVFPELFSAREPGMPVRIWVSGCSSGEEAYSLAIAVIEYLEDMEETIPVQIFSTDLSDPGIDKARAGIYSADIKNDVSPERLKKFFIKYQDNYRINKNIRGMCVFAKQNLIQDPPFSKIDLISCRNVLIYLGQVLQNNVMPVFHYALTDNGFLVLGSAETVGQFTNLFEQIDKKNKIYRKRNTPLKLQMNFPTVKPYAPILRTKKHRNIRINTAPPALEDYYRIADNFILNKFSPASVLVNSALDVVQFRGKANEFLKLPQGEPTYNILKIAKNGFSMELNYLLKKAINDDVPVRKNGIELNTDENKNLINLIVIPIGGAKKSQRLYLIIFEEPQEVIYKDNKGIRNEKVKRESERLLQLKRELLRSNETLQGNIEQLESTNEELRSANEEIQSANEELQSTNEELETAKEELQSTNEELTTVNEELHTRNTELSDINNDLNNLLSRINIPILMLDNDLKIRRFTKMAGKLLNLIPTDNGRKLTDININVQINDFEKMILEVINIPTVKEILVKDNNNNWYIMKIRPYMTLENKIAGVIIAFMDVTQLKLTMSEAEESKKEILKFNETLEAKVDERTKEIGILNKDLEKEIKERKHSEGSLRTLSKYLVSAQEVERKRLSRELHDNINQILSMAKMKLHSTESILKKNNQEQSFTDVIDARKLLEKAISEVRNISKNLRPALDEFGLRSALNSISQEFYKRTKIKVNFICDELSKDIPDEIELNIYRIIQEALHNVEKHSKAKNVKIRLNVKKPYLIINIKDDGKGFNLPDKTISSLIHKKYGLIGMKERAEFLGGKFEIITTPGHGTEIKVKLPY
jgi:two-component system CheB/CheR fusion protein